MVRISLTLFVMIVFSVASFAELITIKTINGKFQFPKEAILEGPDGYLKRALQN